MSFRIHENGASRSEDERSASRRLSIFAAWERTFTLPYFPPACLARFDANCDDGIAQIVYLQALIEDDT